MALALLAFPLAVLGACALALGAADCAATWRRYAGHSRYSEHALEHAVMAAVQAVLALVCAATAWLAALDVLSIAG